MLLTREQFKELVFNRDNYKCIVCQSPAIDAHHLIERTLFKETFEFGGYFLNNGVSLCSQCHILAENTTYTVETLRSKAGITSIILPSHFEFGIYDKWGNTVTKLGRFKGEMFYTEQVQKILKNNWKIRNLFID